MQINNCLFQIRGNHGGWLLRRRLLLLAVCNSLVQRGMLVAWAVYVLWLLSAFRRMVQGKCNVCGCLAAIPRFSFLLTSTRRLRRFAFGAAGGSRGRQGNSIFVIFVLGSLQDWWSSSATFFFLGSWHLRAVQACIQRVSELGRKAANTRTRMQMHKCLVQCCVDNIYLCRTFSMFCDLTGGCQIPKHLFGRTTILSLNTCQGWTESVAAENVTMFQMQRICAGITFFWKFF